MSITRVTSENSFANGGSRPSFGKSSAAAGGLPAGDVTVLSDTDEEIEVLAHTHHKSTNQSVSQVGSSSKRTHASTTSGHWWGAKLVEAREVKQWKHRAQAAENVCRLLYLDPNTFRLS